MLSRSNPSGVAAPVGKYHHITTVPAGVDLVVSGQVGNHLDGSPMAGDVAGQARRAFANIGVIVEGLGVTLACIAKLVTFVVGVEGLPGFRLARD